MRTKVFRRAMTHLKRPALTARAKAVRLLTRLTTNEGFYRRDRPSRQFHADAVWLSFPRTLDPAIDVVSDLIFASVSSSIVPWSIP